MNYEMTGKVQVIEETQEFGNNGFTKRNIILAVETGTWKENICIAFNKDKIDLITGLKVGETVTVGFNISCREWNGKYFTNLNGWKITKESPVNVPVAPESLMIDDYDDDIPF